MAKVVSWNDQGGFQRGAFNGHWGWSTGNSSSAWQTTDFPQSQPRCGGLFASAASPGSARYETGRLASQPCTSSSSKLPSRGSRWLCIERCILRSKWYYLECECYTRMHHLPLFKVKLLYVCYSSSKFRIN